MNSRVKRILLEAWLYEVATIDGSFDDCLEHLDKRVDGVQKSRKLLYLVKTYHSARITETKPKSVVSG